MAFDRLPGGLAGRLLDGATWRLRLATSTLRSLPDFLIIGAQKAGTSSLFSYLSQHPEIFPASRKEVHYFDGGLDPQVDSYAKGPAWYRAHFPLRASLRGHAKTGEATPLYLFNPLAPERISRLLPGVKLIAALRNPTDRAISHYYHEKRRGREALPILEALQQEERRLEEASRCADYKSSAFVHCSFKSRGLYREQLERYLGLFPREQLFVLSAEDLFREPETTLTTVYRFLEVDDRVETPDLSPRNVGSNRESVEPSVRDYLDRYFEPHNRGLFTLLGRRFDW